MSTKEDWREKIEQNDIANAERKSGVSRQTYYNSLKTDPSEWTNKMIEIHLALKEVVEEREANKATKLAELGIKI